MNILQTRNLTKYYGKEPLLVKALDGINMEIEQGSFTAYAEAYSFPNRICLQWL